jgi:hypothetical protein
MLDFLRRRGALSVVVGWNWRSAAALSGGKGSEPPAMVAVLFLFSGGDFFPSGAQEALAATESGMREAA